jgi:hypothetical protein
MINNKKTEKEFENSVKLVFRKKDIWIAHKGNEWFYADLNEKPIYDARFEYVWHFFEDIACAKINGLYCHINKKGKILYDERYYIVHHFKNGKSLVKETEKSKPFYINKNFIRIN